MAIRFMCLASCGKCSLILMPGTLVSISLTGPPFLWPGLRSKVSICEGPPFIHKRMQAFLRAGCAAAAAARFSIQPDMDTPAKPRLVRRNQSRRLRVGFMGVLLLLVVEVEL